MAKSKFVIADPHFTQASMCAFASPDGVTPLRPWGRAMPNWKAMSDEERADLMPEFNERAAEMDEALVERWNATVPEQGATVYVLGDVAMKEKHLAILDRLNGKKKLIPGNHDILSYKVYARYFYEIAAYRIADGVIMSHIPIHEESLNARWKANVHGHLHADRVMMPSTVVTRPEYASLAPGQEWDGRMKHSAVTNPRYLCVSVEHTNYTPLAFDEMFDRIAKQQEAA